MDSVFVRLVKGLSFAKYKDKFFTMDTLMEMHRHIFKLKENLHDLVCKGKKDYD